MNFSRFRLRPLASPPQHLMTTVGSRSPESFALIGGEFFEYFKSLCALQPTERVLDVGCGPGRMAIPLMDYLNESASYRGFDVDKAAVDWCRRNITPRRPNFKFQWADLRNTFYHSKGARDASRYRFPYDDNSFDFAIAASVFTHVLPATAENYLREIRRTLRPGGRALMTFFLVDREVTVLVRERKSTLAFSPAGPVHFVHEPRNPEVAVAFQQTYINEQIA